MSTALTSGSICLALVTGCSSGSSHGTGGVDQGCYPNGTCNAGLSCFSNVCVQYDGAAADGATPTQDGGTEVGFDGGDDGEGSDAAVMQAAMALAQSYCNKAASCLGQATGYPDVATCTTLEQLWLADELSAPGALWSLDSATACASATTSATCTDFENSNVTQCDPPPGVLKDGSACAYGEQCASGTCAVANDSVCGVCVEPAAQGSMCANTSTCGAGLDCSPGGECLPEGDAGAPCTSGSTYCDYPLGCVNGVCTQEAQGDSCSYTEQDCATALFCSSATNTCQAFAWAPPGGTCGWVAGNDSLWRGCSVSFTCPVPSGGETATCPAVAQVGQACNASAVCLLPYVCTSAGVCSWTPASQCK
jgi:hypothetical protein